MKIALYQMKMTENPTDNLKMCIHAIEDAGNAGADLILFPELTLLQFFPQYSGLDGASYSIPITHEVICCVQEACQANHIYAVPNFYLREQDAAYDASLLIDREGKIVGSQKMVHIAQAAHFYEQEYYTPSDDGFHVFETDCGKIGIVVCFDRHYPESIRTEALRGADLVLIPTANTKAEPLEMFEWEIRVQAFQNCVPIAMCNRTGRENDMDFAGESLVTDADGKMILKTSSAEGLYFAEVDMQSAETARKSRPYTILRRQAFYE